MGDNIRPYICAPVRLIAPGNIPTTDNEFQLFKKFDLFLREPKDTHLRFGLLNLSTVKLVLVSYASFANTRGLKSHLGYIIALLYSSGRALIVHYGINRYRQVVRSVMASEGHVLVLGLYYSFIINQFFLYILGREVVLESYKYSKTIFKVLHKNSSTTERRLQIDIFGLRESY